MLVSSSAAEVNSICGCVLVHVDVYVLMCIRGCVHVDRLYTCCCAHVNAHVDVYVLICICGCVNVDVYVLICTC